MLDPAYANSDIGNIREIQGSAAVVRGADSLPATKGFRISKGDLLQTAENSRIVLVLMDGTRVVVGQNSRLSMDDYSFSPETQKGGMLIGFLKGTMRMMTGLLAKANPESTVIRTPTATAGVRGTDFIVEVP